MHACMHPAIASYVDMYSYSLLIASHYSTAKKDITTTMALDMALGMDQDIDPELNLLCLTLNLEYFHLKGIANYR